MKTALAVIALALLAGVSTAHAFTCNQVRDEEADTEAMNRQWAQCYLDAGRYEDEHPIHGATADETATLGAQRYAKRFDLCLNAAGWPSVLALTPETHKVRVLEKWQREGVCSREDMDFLQRDIDHLRKFSFCLSQNHNSEKCSVTLFDKPVTPVAPPRAHTTVTQADPPGLY